MKSQRSSSSSSRHPFIESTPKGLFIRVRLQPRASRNAIEGYGQGALRLRLTAPPVEGEANRALVELLSRAIGVKKSALTIDSGQRSRDKRIRVEGVDPKWLDEAFDKALA